MLDAQTKARIDSARDVLVGKVPDPKSQVEQITIALIYKFMDDMDRQSEEIGGKAAFFTGEFKKYRWAQLLDKRYSGLERLLLYAEGIEKMNINKNIPQLFRDIFKGVFLPYRDPETLNLFLKEINFFTYDHSERLGDAFEYLLSILGTQGEAGQFRTPRHIIDFIVAVVDPKKTETVLDPACGTAGFLISAYKHILEGNENLTPDERARLMTNFRGYDIAPDMVRLARANMYLHGFPNPTIHEYDALTSEERWDEHCDVILANPPFMSPKGGIRPHNRFSIQAKRSEVLFVDYIAEHLNPGGRAGVIVPEGIIFQSQNAYKQLRKMLVKNYLWAVVSLPAGVFKRYSGVKTSILFLDRNLARQRDEVLFVKIENDGFALGAHRRPIAANDLPAALTALKGVMASTDRKSEIANRQYLSAPRARLLASPDINLSGDRYRVATARPIGKWQMVKLGEVCEVIAGQSPDGSTYNDRGDGTPFHQGKTEFGDTVLGEAKCWTTVPARIAEVGDVVMSMRAPVGPVNIVREQVCIGRGLAAIRAQARRIGTMFLFHLLRGMEDKITGSHGAAFASINRSEIESIEIPLPPLDEQERIVAELEGYRKVIEGARQILAAYKPTIRIDPKWPMVKVGEVCEEMRSGFACGPAQQASEGVPHLRPMNISAAGELVWEGTKFIKPSAFESKQDFALRAGDVLFNNTNSKELVGKTCLIRSDMWAGYSNHLTRLRCDPKRCVPQLLADILHEMWRCGAFLNLCHKWVGQAGINNAILASIEIPFPPLDEQERIVAELEAERKLVEANRELIARMEAKIKAKLSEVWGY